MNRGLVFILRYYSKISAWCLVPCAEEIVGVAVSQALHFRKGQVAELRDLRRDITDRWTVRGVFHRTVRLQEKSLRRDLLHKLAVVHRMIVQYGRSDRDVAVQGDDVGDKAAGTGEAVEEKCLGGLESLEGLEGLDCLHHLTPAFGPMKHNRATKFQR